MSTTGESTGVFAGSIYAMLSHGLTTGAYTDPHGYGTTAYDAGTWTGGWRETPFGHTQAVASWIASTPAGTWIQVELRARAGDRPQLHLRRRPDPGLRPGQDA